METVGGEMCTEKAVIISATRDYDVNHPSGVWTAPWREVTTNLDRS